MNIIRPRALLAATLVLVISACSQVPENLTTPTLEPQFGTTDDDIGIDVASASTGRIYSLSKQSGAVYEDGYEGQPDYQIGDYGKVFLKRHDSSGKVIWSLLIGSAKCAPDGDYLGNDCGRVGAVSLVADAQGNVSALTTSMYSGTSMDVDYHSLGYSIEKYNASGQLVSSIHLNDGESESSRWPSPSAFMVDGSGNTYVTRYSYSSSSYTVAKFSTSGTLLWQRTSPVGNLSDITVSGSGSVYVVGNQGMARYTGSGGLSWTKPGNFEEVIVSGSNLYTRYRKDIRKYDGTGKQLWLRTQRGLNTIVLQDMDGDSTGNVYLSGKYDASGGNFNAMTRKLNASGSVLWTKTYGTPAYDDARGIDTITGSEIYTTGETQGSLTHTNRGGRDGYVRKQNSTGGLIWTR
jgi:hypothetical protein